jgi:transposase
VKAARWVWRGPIGKRSSSVTFAGWLPYQNLSKCLSTLLANALAELRRAEQEKAASTEAGGSPQEVRREGETAAVQQAQRARREERTQRYEQIIALRTQGMGTAEISDQMNMPARTIRHWLARGSAPDFRQSFRRSQTHLSGPLQTYLLERWHQGCRNVLQLERERRSRGYKGSRRSLYRMIATFAPIPTTLERRHHKESSDKPTVDTSSPQSALSLSVQQATWLFFRKQADLDEAEQENLEQLRQAHPHIEKAYHLVSAFLQMMRKRTGQQLEQWLSDVQESGLLEFESFLTGIQRDKDAVLAGLTLPWSNGPTEGHVNRLKLIKRSMYGRAKFDLLRLRVLHRSEDSQQKKEMLGRVRQ